VAHFLKGHLNSITSTKGGGRIVRKLSLFFLALTSFLFIGFSIALAGPVVNLDQTGIGPGQNVYVDFPNDAGGVYPNGGTVFAGVLKFNINGQPDILGFCIENAWVNSASGFSEYRLLQITPADIKWETAAYIADQNFSTSNSVRAAAAQLVIWELVFESSTTALGTIDLFGGSFKTLAPANNAVVVEAMNIINNELPNAAQLAKFNENSWMLAVSPKDSSPLPGPEPYQNFLVHVNAPIPAAAWLLGTGLIGLIGIRSKKKK
jgi:hypothetical protein